jgi:hypothetical protein
VVSSNFSLLRRQFLPSNQECIQKHRIFYKKLLKNKLTRHLNTKIHNSVRRDHALMDSKIPMILEILSDGKWHEIKELQQRMELDEYKVQEITAFLNKYNFATLDDDNKKVKINRGFQKFLAQTTT